MFMVIYWLIGKRIKNVFLLAFSCFFYAWGEPLFIFVILGTTLLDYFLVRQMDRSVNVLHRKVLLSVSIIVNVGILFACKYMGFFIDNLNGLLTITGSDVQVSWTELIFPIGISFYTFETITYVVDVYRRVHKPLTNFFDYLLYIICFPKLIAGPIVRYKDIADQIADRSSSDTTDMKLSGFYTFCFGLARKVLIADTMGVVADSIYGDASTGAGAVNAMDLTTSAAWIAAIAYSFQIYFDFSGYSNMAIGLGKMMGFRFPENFNNPYMAESITDFWKRWHISLSSWMRNYLYIPLGGNRVRLPRMYFNLLIVFVLSGFWHGASWNFIVWGLWHGFFLVLERMFLLRWTAYIGRVGRVLFTFSVVVLGWVMFRIDNIEKAIEYICAMFGTNNSMVSCNLGKQQWFYGALAVLFSWYCFSKRFTRFQTTLIADTKTLSEHIWLTPASLLLYFISIAVLAGGSFNSFIYFRF